MPVPQFRQIYRESQFMIRVFLVNQLNGRLSRLLIVLQRIKQCLEKKLRINFSGKTHPWSFSWMSFEVLGAEHFWEKEEVYQSHASITEISNKLIIYKLALQIQMAFLYQHRLGR